MSTHCVCDVFTLYSVDLMTLQSFWTQYWPLVLIVAWFGYKLWNTRRVRAMLPRLRQSGAVLIDVRTAGEFAGGHAPDSINIPLAELGSRLSEVPRGVPLVLCCASGSRSGMAKMLLRRHGYKPVYNIGNWGHLLTT